eukprot:gene23210-biopygen23812
MHVFSKQVFDVSCQERRRRCRCYGKTAQQAPGNSLLAATRHRPALPLCGRYKGFRWAPLRTWHVSGRFRRAPLGPADPRCEPGTCVVRSWHDSDMRVPGRRQDVHVGTTPTRRASGASEESALPAPHQPRRVPWRAPWRAPWRVPRRVPRRVPWRGPVHHSTSERSERGECFTRTPPTPPRPEARPVARPEARPVARPAARSVARPGPSLDERAERARRVLYPHPTNSG